MTDAVIATGVIVTARSSTTSRWRLRRIDAGHGVDVTVLDVGGSPVVVLNTTRVT
jgi:hypothetical protein